MKAIKKVLNNIFIDGLSGMALGLFSTLIIGTILKQIGDLMGGTYGAYLSAFVRGQWLEIVMAIFLIILSITLSINKNFRIVPTPTHSLLGGATSGFVSGFLGTGGAIRGLTLAAYQLPMAVFIATSALIDLGIDCSRTVVYYYNGYIHQKDLYLLPILLVVSVVGTRKATLSSGVYPHGS